VGRLFRQNRTVENMMTRGQMQDFLSKFAAESPANRQALINDPKAVIEQQLRTSFGHAEVKAVVETADTVYIVVPDVATDTRVQLSEGEIAGLSGGSGDFGGGDVQDGGTWS
jgi:hypothetical protein